MHIYIILLEALDKSKDIKLQDKYYITKSDVKVAEDILKVYSKPKEPSLAWMKKYKPTKIIEVIKPLHEKTEYYIMIHYMKLYGIDNVRSSVYPDLFLPEKVKFTLECDMGIFVYIDKYQSYNYVPLFVSSVQKHLHTFFNSNKYIESSNKDYTLQEEINRLQLVIKNIKELQKLINVSSGVYYGPYTNRTFIDFIDLSKNNELMNKIYYYDDNYIAKGNRYDLDRDYRDILEGIYSIADKLDLITSCKKRSILLLNLIEFNIQKKKDLHNLMLQEANSHDVKYTTIDLIEYIILGLTEEKLKLYVEGVNYERINEYAPPPYEDNYKHEEETIRTY